MARSLQLTALGASIINKHSSSATALISRLSPPPPPPTRSNSVRHCSSSQRDVYKIDHSGFVNPLEPNPPRNDQLGIRDKIVNRNPRVLERLNIASRQNGWQFQAPKRDYQNKLVFDMSGRYVLAYVEHNSGEKVVWASSQEHSLAKRLYSLADISAVKAVAHVLARRCLKAGLHNVAVIEPAQVRETSQRLAAFLDILSSHGIGLEEPKVVLPPQRFGVDYDVFDSTRYVDEEAQAVVWPQSKEDYDPDKDVLWENEGIQRKHHLPVKTWDDFRPLVDPEPKKYPKAGAEKKELEVELNSTTRMIAETEIKLID